MSSLPAPRHHVRPGVTAAAALWAVLVVAGVVGALLVARSVTDALAVLGLTGGASLMAAAVALVAPDRD